MATSLGAPFILPMIQALGDEEVVNEFETYFSSLVGDVEKNNDKYSAAMRQLEDLLALERETAAVKAKVAAFNVDYNDDLVSGMGKLQRVFIQIYKTQKKKRYWKRRKKRPQQ